jgi:ABC-type transport system involved in multi-copper enzyme maturation permease subunit
MKLKALLRFTTYEAVRRGTLLFYFAVGIMIIAVFAIWMGHAPGDPSSIVLFGKQFPGIINGISSADFLLLMLFRQSTFWIIVLGTFAVAGLMTSFLEKGTVELYLSKPLDRWQLFLGRALGASLGVVANVLFCIIGLWLVFGIKLGVWHTGFVTAGLLVSYAFVCYYSIVAFIGVWSRNAILSIIFGLFFSFTSIGLEAREKGLYQIWDNVIYHRALDAIYYLTPQLDGMLSNATRLIGQIPFGQEQATFTIAPYLWSLASATLFYALSIYYFSKQDY